ncbi:glutathione S-transferase [Saccharata proteae CBS 121410]|uniref:glutathione transferase n=1 Tax=Saccharata proteae CBS 121410 TaxID=1314787 RepID=A0A9P4HQC8_9PEZI|nr:glutathione S-transferase [Saccharata proteae CBS 121410]
MSSEATGSNANKGAKITLYWLEKSRAHRILWLLEELKLDYELKIFKRTKDRLAPPELKEVHPLGKSPVVGLQGPDADKPLMLAESGAIVEYLTEHFGEWLIPKKWKEGKEGQVGGETEEWMRYRFFMHYAEGSMMPLLVISLMFWLVETSPVPFFIKPVTKGIAGRIKSLFLEPNFKTHFGFLEEQLTTAPGGGGAFFCGKELTGADILMSYPLEGAQMRAGLSKEAYPKLNAYVERLHEREAYKKAVAKIEEVTGEKYDPNVLNNS